MTPFKRYQSGLAPLDHVLDGGVMPGTVVLIDGRAGSGKTTLGMQWIDGLGRSCLCASADETPAQMEERAERLDLRLVDFIHETDIDTVLKVAANCDVVLIDPIQRFTHTGSGAVAGTIEQMAACVRRVVTFAKRSGDKIVILISQEDGHDHVERIGPVRHMVDVMLKFEVGEGNVRILDTSWKNRFGMPARDQVLLTSHGFISVSSAQ